MISEILLPSVSPCSSSVRSDTGTIALSTRSSVLASWPISKSRSAPLHAASTTSLMLTDRAAFRSRVISIDTSAWTQRLCGDTGRFHGAGSGFDWKLAAVRTTFVTDSIAGFGLRADAAPTSSWPAVGSSDPRRSLRAVAGSDGAGRGVHAGGSPSSGGSGARSTIASARSTLAMPSPSAWWVLMISPTSSSSSPSITHISQSGRARSSAIDCTRLTSSIELIAVAGSGQGGEPEVVVEVEVGVVDPDRPALAVRHLHDALPHPRHAVESTADVFANVVEPDPTRSITQWRRRR